MTLIDSRSAIALVAIRHAVEAGCGVQDFPRFDGAVEDVRHQLLDVGADRRRPAGQADIAAEEAAHADRRVLVLRNTDAADDAAWANDPECLLVGGHVAYGLEDHVRAVPARQLADLGDAFLVARGNDVGGAELPAELGARRVATHEDDLFGSEALG